MEQYKKRCEMHRGKQIDNSKLYAGSPMYYYCKYCGVQTMIVPESYCGAISRICEPCDLLHKHGLV